MKRLRYLHDKVGPFFEMLADQEEGFTDGSVLDPEAMTTGGGGYTLVDAARRAHRGKRAAGQRCNSYRAELTALLKILDDLIAGADDTGSDIAFPDGDRCEIRLALDSQSAIQALSKGPNAQNGALELTVWERMIRLCATRHCHITVQYVPGHCDLTEQEEADVIAKEASRTEKQSAVPLSLGLVKAVLKAAHRPALCKRVATGPLGDNHLWLRTTEGGKTLRHTGLSRREQTTLSCLRAGRSRITRDVDHRLSEVTRTVKVPPKGDHGLETKNGIVSAVAPGSAAEEARIPLGARVEKIAGVEVDTDQRIATALRSARRTLVRVDMNTQTSTACPAGCGAPDSVEHMLCHCPEYTKARLDAFNTYKPSISVLRSQPCCVTRFLRQIGRLHSNSELRRKALETVQNSVQSKKNPSAAASVPSRGANAIAEGKDSQLRTSHTAPASVASPPTPTFHRPDASAVGHAAHAKQ